MILVGPAKEAEDQAIRTLHAPLSGVAVIDVPPNASPARLYSEFLMTLGKSRWNTAVSLPGDRFRVAAELWLRAYEIEEVVLLHADAVDREAWRGLAALERDCALRLWLLVDSHRLGKTRLAVGIAPVVRSTLLELTKSITVAAAPNGVAAAVDATPDSWQRESDRLRADPVHLDAYRLGFVDAAATPIEGRANLALVATGARDSAEQFADRRCLLSALEGMKVAFVEYGWRLMIDVDLLAGKARQATPRERFRHLDAAAVAVYADPLSASTMTLASLELSEREMLTVVRDDFANDLTWVRIGRDVVPIEPVARPLLRAQMIAGEELGASPHHPFLGDPNSIGIHRLRSTILDLYDDLDIGLTVGELRDRPTRDILWLADRGVSIERLPTSRRPARIAGIYDPIGEMDRFRASLTDDWRAATVGTEPCACLTRHLPPTLDALPSWPPKPRRAPAKRGHPWLFGTRPARRAGLGGGPSSTDSSPVPNQRSSPNLR